MKVLLCLCRSALNHDELDLVDLISVIGCPLADDRQVLQVPDDDASIVRGRGHIAVAKANLDVYDHVCVAVEGGLQDHRLFVPNFYYAANV